jgi:hypothetical protein
VRIIIRDKSCGGVRLLLETCLESWRVFESFSLAHFSKNFPQNTHHVRILIKKDMITFVADASCARAGATSSSSSSSSSFSALHLSLRLRRGGGGRGKKSATMKLSRCIRGNALSSTANNNNKNKNNNGGGQSEIRVINKNNYDMDHPMYSSRRLYDTPDCRNLLVVGPGVLGSLVCQKWLEMFPAAIVVGQTNSTKNHESLEKLGITARTEDTFEHFDPKTYPYVVFSAPPSGSDDYPGEIKKALEKWNGKNEYSGFCFTSSSAVFPDNIDCDDDTATLKLGANPRADRLLNAENVVLEHENRRKEKENSDDAVKKEKEEGKNENYQNRAAVLRLAGLYHSLRGAHTYFMKAGTIESRPDALVNCIHYEDAADLVVKVLLREDAQRNVFLGCDGHPITREDVATCALESGCFDNDDNDSEDGQKHSKHEFTKSEGPVGRRMTCEGTRKALGWAPKFTSFRDFFDKETNKGKDSFAEEASPFGWNHSSKTS